MIFHNEQFGINDMKTKKLRRSVKFSIFLLVFVTTSCVTIYNKSSLQIDKIQELDNSSLRLDGYFYTVSHDSSITPMILFGNGYMHEIATYDEANPKDTIKKRLKSDNYFHPINKKYSIWGWGIWWTQNDSIFIEQYRNYLGDYDISYRYGKVLNDSTFIIEKDSSRFQKPVVRYVKDIYKFQKMDSKPDSTNYIKENIDEFGRKNEH